MSNTIMGKQLSLAAKGMLFELLGKPQDWHISIDGLNAVLKDGKCSISSALKELEDNGYIQRTKIFAKGANNKTVFAGYFYTIIECPYADFPCTDFQDTEIPFTENRDNYKVINKENNKEINNNRERVSNDTHAQAHSKKPATRIDYDAILSFWNEQMEINGANIPKIREMSKDRKRWIKARLAECKKGIEDIKLVIQKAAVSDFMNRRCGGSWLADFEWIFKKKINFEKVLNKRYDNDYGTSRRDDDETPAAAPTTEIFEVQDEDGNTEIVEIEHKPIVRHSGEITATLEDVTMLFVQLGYDANFAQPFFDYYASQGWRKANGQKITRLDTMIRAWMEREREIQLEKLTKKEKELNYADAGYEERTQRFIDHISQLYATRAGVPDNMESDEAVDILPF